MPAPRTLRHGEWSLDTPVGPFVFGVPDRGIWNRTTPDLGDIEIRAGDVDRERGDGRAFGRDYLGARTISFDLWAHARIGLREAVEDMRAWWRFGERDQPGAVTELTAMYDGRARSVFGRPRKFTADYSRATTASLAAITCDFACIDDLFYGPEDDSVTVRLARSVTGGLVTPLVAPLSTTRTSDRSSVLRIDSKLPVWPVVTIHGPVVNPVVVIGEVTLDARLTLAYDQEVVIDARPWARTATRGGVSVAGAVRGTRLADTRLAPGEHEVTLKGQDNTGTSSVTVSWRPTFASL